MPHTNSTQKTVREASTGLPAAKSTIQIVMADDDRNEQLLTVLAAEEAGVDADFTFVDDGVQLLVLLNRRLEEGTLPDLILLDLRMPVLDGHRTLSQLQAHPVLWQIPVVVFSSSTRREDVDRSFSAGASWFETKPSEYSEMVKFIQTLPGRAGSGYDLSKNGPAYDRGSDHLEIDLRDFDF